MLKHSFWILLPCVIFLIFIYLFIPRQTLSCIPNAGCTLEEKSVISGSINILISYMVILNQINIINLVHIDILAHIFLF